MKLSLIVAFDRNHAIGRDNDLPWKLPDDLKRFKALTLGKPILMGRKTYESIGRPLPERRNIILTRQLRYQAPGCTVVGTVESALEVAKGADELMVIGGTAIYAEMLPRCERIYLTRIHEIIEGDTWFPEIDTGQWRLVSREDCPANEDRPHSFSYLVLDRR